MRIYVERIIEAPLDQIWKHTQTPDLHERWDLRFTQIEYLPRPNKEKPQQFLYATRIGFGLKIEGKGETTGIRESSENDRTSALRFWSDDEKSLIREGSGYWKYKPNGQQVRFLTAYDYQVRFGALGRVFDRFIFRPLMGWATAWSFDRLGLWLEKGESPESSLQWSITHSIARLSLALVWIYHGLVPKLLVRDPTELAMIQDMGISPDQSVQFAVVAGLLEAAFGLLLLFFWRSRWPLALTIGLMVFALLSVSWYSPHMLTTAFNVVTLNLLTIALSLIDWIACIKAPTASRCLRTPPSS